MKKNIQIGLARVSDAKPIALMSRELIEAGLTWRWKPSRVVAQIRRRDSIVIVAKDRSTLAGFAIMHFGRELAHLNLLAVSTPYQRIGVGSALLRWLEECALVSGVATIQLELRANNVAARAFYKSFGYEEVVLIPRYYAGREAALRMARFLRLNERLASLLYYGISYDKTSSFREPPA